MAKRRMKKRTHAGAKNPATAAPGHADMRNPKSMVIRIGAGEVGSSVSQLAADVRKVMEPGTASRLKERRGNKLKDYVVMAGPLGVTHLMLFSRSESGNTNLRIATTPRGPTLNFRVEKYSLCKDVQRAQRRPQGLGNDAIAPPLLVMNNFSAPGSDNKSAVPKHLESLATTVFQSLFPPINPQTTSLKTIRRVLLLNRELSPENDGSFIINFRHYAITTKVKGISKPLKRLNAAEKLMAANKFGKGGVPNLGKLEDIADYMIGADGNGYMTDGTSGSEAETDAEIEVIERTAKKLASSKAKANEEDEDADADRGVEKRSVKMVELGPRMKLRLTKVEDGLCSGKPMWHEYISKSKKEEQELDQRWDKRREEKDARRREQKANVEAKKKTRGGDKAAEDDADDVEMGDYDYEYDSEGLGADGEAQLNAEAEENDEWEDQEEEIANG
ncbi:ribosome biogenesis protein SSF1 [Plectosphaerella cucumerina]|uniref:Ribosome biogenesis protein SSF1 n=1 Tax=Plectosphaerella cucumerina TaxID=40658 RepID=A0A8K0TM43_9PEZI|nr:ribosome biogenesis protein SSF1 [Plectosphaerella cucumerina]